MAIPISEVLTRAGMNRLLSELKIAMDKVYASKSYVEEKLVNVGSSVLADSITGLKYKLGVEDGTLVLTETDEEPTLNPIILTDSVTGSSYTIIIENGSLLLVETNPVS